jgi:hypothetical protein
MVIQLFSNLTVTDILKRNRRYVAQHNIRVTNGNLLPEETDYCATETNQESCETPRVSVLSGENNLFGFICNR